MEYSNRIRRTIPLILLAILLPYISSALQEDRHDNAIVMDINFHNDIREEHTETLYGDLSGTGNNIYMPSNITRRPVRNSQGPLEGSMHFDGIDDIMYAPSANSLDKVRTIEFWASIENTKSSMGILSKYAWQPERGYIIAAPYEDGKYYFKFIEDGNELLKEPIDQYIGKWAHYVLTVDSIGCKLYINGLQVRNGRGYSSTLNNTDDLYLGIDGNWYNGNFKGSLGSIRMYDRPISAEEVKAHYMHETQRFNIPLVWENWIAKQAENHSLKYPNEGGFTAAIKKNVWLSFNNTSSRVVSEKTKGVNLDGDYTVVASVRPLSITSKMTILKIGKSSSQNEKDSEYIIGINRGDLFTVMGNGVASSYTTYGLSIPANAWSIIACGVNASKMWCSVNGVIKTGTERIGYVNIGNDIIIGSNINGTSDSGNFLGDIDYVYIFNQAMTKDQLTGIINNNRVTGSTAISSPSEFYSGNWFQKDGSLLAISGNRLYKSIDGKTYSLIYTFQNISANALNTLIAQDSKNNTFVTFRNDGGRVWVSPANSTGSPNYANFTARLKMSASNGTGAGLDSFQELPNGDILFGEYGNDITDGKHAMIYKTSDNGKTWGLSFNDSEYSAGLSHTSPGRHVHFVKRDPYTGYIYASIGDSKKNRKLIRSVDNGNTWNILMYGTSDNYNWQPASVVFTDEYRIYGEDWSSIGLDSRIIRTKDDVNYETVCNGDSKYLGAWYWSAKDNNGRIYFGLSEVPWNANMTVVASDDNGTSWYIAYKISGGDYFSDLPSNTGANNQFYINLQNYVEGIEKTIEIKSIGTIEPVVEWRFNENFGDDAYDVASRNDAKIMNAVWQDDGEYSTLTPKVDYELNTDGTFSLKNKDYDRAMVYARYYAK